MKKQDKKTKELLKEFAGTNRLSKFVVKDILEDSEGYNGETLKERILARLEDVSYGCQSGTVGCLIYYKDTTAFFKRYKKEIISLLNDTADGIGETTGSLLSGLNGWDDNDPFAEDVTNQNLLAWFAYEETACRLNGYLESDWR